MGAERVRAVLVGCGEITGLWFDALDRIDEVSVVGLVDLEVERADRLREQRCPDAETSTDLDDMLDRLRPNCVFDCTVPAAHEQVALAAFAHRCHLLGEKPLAPTPEAARRLVKAGRAAGVVHAVVQNWRYSTGMGQLRAAVEAGRIGRPTTLTADFFMAPHFTGFRNAMDHVLLLDMAIHGFDQARFLTGADPLAAQCLEWNPPGSPFAAGAAALATFRMTDDMVFSYRGSWSAEGRPSPWHGEWRLVGDAGTVRWNGADRPSGERRVGPGTFWSDLQPIPVDEPPPMAEGHEGVIRDFLSAIANRTRPPTDASDNLRSLAMVFGAIEAAKTGGWVDLRPYYD